MSENQSRWVDRRGNDGIRTADRQGDTARRDPGDRRRGAIRVLGILVVLGAGLLQPGWSRGQQAPDGDEAERKPAPAQSRESIEALSLKYRFIETYGVAENPAKPQLVVDYEVGALETNRYEEEKPQGAPIRNEGTILTKYRERPVRATKVGDVTDLFRRYEVLRPRGDLQLAPSHLSEMSGLSIWYRLRLADAPEILTFEGRSLHELEYNTIIDEIFLPRLKTILPPKPVQVGDTWNIIRSAGRSLVGRMVPDEGEYTLDGTLIEVRKAATGTSLDAVIEVAGEMELEADPDRVKPWGAVKARIHFVFEPPAAAPAPEPRARRKVAAALGVIDARGWIAKVQMGRVRSRPIDKDSRLQQRLTRDLILERRLPKDARAFTVPNEPPTPDQASSWVVYNDPEGRFHFSHPQELQMENGGVESPDSIEFLNKRSTANDALVIGIQPREADPARYRQSLDPEIFIRNLRSTWAKTHQDVVEGESVWLPDKVWAPLKRRVHRFEAALKKTDPSAPRIYYNYYLVVFPRDSVVVMAMTERNDHLVFRNQVEEVIRNFAFGSLPARAPAAGPSRPVRPTPGSSPAAGAEGPTSPAPGTAPTSPPAPGPAAGTAPPVPPRPPR